MTRWRQGRKTIGKDITSCSSTSAVDQSPVYLRQTGRVLEPQSGWVTQAPRMQHIYMQSNEHFEVFTTVLSPQVSRGRLQYKHEEAEMMVAMHSYKPNWSYELELSQGDVIQVLSKHEEARWFGRRQSGQRGYFPTSHVMEFRQRDESARDLRRSLSVRSPSPDCVSWVRGNCADGHKLQALKRGSMTEGALEGDRGERPSPILVPRHQTQTPLAQAPQSQATGAPGLFKKILLKRLRRSEGQGASNEAFEAD